MAKKNNSMSHWIIEASKHGIDLSSFHSDKLQDRQRLRASGLPCWDEIKIPYSCFDGKNNELGQFLARYNLFIVKAIPKTSKLPRESKRGVASLEQCLNFLADKINPENTNLYSVVLSEWRPTKYGGIIISDLERAKIDIGEQLDELEHGLAVPTTGVWDGRSMKYTTNDSELKRIMWKTFRYVRALRGYFEFVITGENETKFVDYKLNEKYLSQ